MCFHIPAHKSGTAGQVSGSPFSANRAHYQPDTSVVAEAPYNNRACNSISKFDWSAGCPDAGLLAACYGGVLDAPDLLPVGDSYRSLLHDDGKLWWQPTTFRDN